eukprot:2381355-Rhodomonas_salina.2
MVLAAWYRASVWCWLGGTKLAYGGGWAARVSKHVPLRCSLSSYAPATPCPVPEACSLCTCYAMPGPRRLGIPTHPRRYMCTHGRVSAHERNRGGRVGRGSRWGGGDVDRRAGDGAALHAAARGGGRASVQAQGK